MWPRLLADSFGTRPRFLGDSGPGSCVTPEWFWLLVLSLLDDDVQRRQVVGEVVIVLVELWLVEQRYQAVLEVLNNASTVTDVAVRFGVTRQTVHRWLRKYATDGIAGLADRGVVTNPA